MWCGRIRNRDYVYRHCVFPLAFRKNKYFDERNLFRLYDGATPGVIETSFVWERLAPRPELVHAYGCRRASKLNQKLREEGRFKEDRRRVYCGSYALRTRSVR